MPLNHISKLKAGPHKHLLLKPGLSPAFAIQARNPGVIWPFSPLLRPVSSVSVTLQHLRIHSLSPLYSYHPSPSHHPPSPSGVACQHPLRLSSIHYFIEKVYFEAYLSPNIHSPHFQWVIESNERWHLQGNFVVNCGHMTPFWLTGCVSGGGTCLSQGNAHPFCFPFSTPAGVDADRMAHQTHGWGLPRAVHTLELSMMKSDHR